MKNENFVKNSYFCQNFSKFQSHIPQAFRRNPGTPPGNFKNHQKNVIFDKKLIKKVIFYDKIIYSISYAMESLSMSLS